MSSRHLMIVAAVGVFSSAIHADTIYVDDDAPLGGDGLSWGTAYQFLQDALANAAGVTEIRVAQGTYKPDQDEAGNVTPGDRTATFQLVNGVALMGGFAGIGAPDPDERDSALFETILSGDLLGNDGADFANYDENSSHVLNGSDTQDTLLDGFTITGGNAENSTGGGMVIGGTGAGNPTVANCTFIANQAGQGGGIWLLGSTTVNNCTFMANGASQGAGMLIFGGDDATVTNCTFIANVADLPFGGGGMRIRGFGSSPTVSNCTFIENSAPEGGGMFNFDATPKVMNCSFIGNAADEGGGMRNGSFSNPTVINCTFVGNSAENRGGAMRGSALVSNCTFTGNTAPAGAGIFNGDIVSNCIVWGNIPDSIGGPVSPLVRFSDIEGGFAGPGNIRRDPLFVDPDNGDYRLSPGSPCIDAGDNTAVPEGIRRDLDGNPRIVVGTTMFQLNAEPRVDMGAYEYQPDSSVETLLRVIYGSDAAAVARQFGLRP
jgi:hypothetical protein